MCVGGGEQKKVHRGRLLVAYLGCSLPQIFPSLEQSTFSKERGPIRKRVLLIQAENSHDLISNLLYYSAILRKSCLGFGRHNKSGQKVFPSPFVILSGNHF